MQDLFQCPHCGVRTIVDPEYIGQTGPCAECGKTVTIWVEQSSASSKTGATGTHNKARKGSRPVLPIILATMVLLAIVAVVITVFVTSTSKPRVAPVAVKQRSALAANNIRSIGQALLAYQKIHNRFPPAVVTDQNGKAMHSWRVLILPQLGYRDLYKQYNFNFAWDHPANDAVIRQMPTEYASPDDPNAVGLSATNYFAVAGFSTIFSDNIGTQISQIKDGHKNTLMLIEVDNSTTTWTSPIDFEANQQRLTDGSGATNLYTQSGMLVLTADGKPHVLDPAIAPETLQTLSFVDDNPGVRIEDFEAKKK